jgi:hypothetical protein
VSQNGIQKKRFWPNQINARVRGSLRVSLTLSNAGKLFIGFAFLVQRSLRDLGDIGVAQLFS